MPTFLDLPREIRDEIYAYCLISPTGLVAPYLLPRITLKPSRRRVKPAKTSKSKQKLQLHLITSPLTLTSNDEVFNNPEVFREEWKSRYLSLSITSTCRQIYNETRGLFWSRNTFFFDGFAQSAGSGRGLGVVRTLKGMGQTASRLIERITIHMPVLGLEYNGLKKMLNTLSSRARLGRFRRLELVWGEEEMWALVADLRWGETPLFWGVCEDLREGCEGVRFERVVRLPGFEDVRRRKAVQGGLDGREWYERIVDAVHCAVGGTMVCGGVVRKDRVMVGDVQGGRSS